MTFAAIIKDNKCIINQDEFETLWNSIENCDWNKIMRKIESVKNIKLTSGYYDTEHNHATLIMCSGEDNPPDGLLDERLLNNTLKALQYIGTEDIENLSSRPFNIFCEILARAEVRSRIDKYNQLFINDPRFKEFYENMLKK